MWSYLHKELKQSLTNCICTQRYPKLMSQVDCNLQEIITESFEVIPRICFELFFPMNAFTSCLEQPISKLSDLGTERPTETHQVRRHSPIVLVWCAVSKDEVLGPYFFENETVNSNSYKGMLCCYLILKLREYPNNTIFHRDVAPPDCSSEERNYHDEKLP